MGATFRKCRMLLIRKRLSKVLWATKTSRQKARRRVRTHVDISLTVAVPIGKYNGVAMTKRYLAIVGWVLACSPLLLGLDSPSEKGLKLEPQPKEVQLRDGGFQVGPRTKIFVQLGHQAEDRIAAETLAEEVQYQSGLKLNIFGMLFFAEPSLASIGFHLDTSRAGDSVPIRSANLRRARNRSRRMLPGCSPVCWAIS